MRAYVRHRGFTLVELLTVIAIIALLSAILFPVFSQVRKKGAQTVCLSNLSQLGKAIQMYITDTSGFIPTWCITYNNPGSPPPNPTAAGTLTWDAVIMPYMKNSEIVKCGSNPNANGKQARAYAIAHYTQRPVGSPGASEQWYAVRGCYLDEIPAPSRTVLLFEKGMHPPTAWGDALGQNVWETHSHIGATDYSDAMFHFDGKNILYLDGHAKFSQSGQYPFDYKSNRTSPLESIAGDVWFAGKASAGGDWPENQ